MAGKAQNPGHFLVGIAGLIRNSEGDYLLMKRGAARDFGAESWECVTGRVNQGESIEQALHRWMSAAAAARFLSNGLSGSTNLVEQTDCLQFAGAVPPRVLGPDLPRPAHVLQFQAHGERLLRCAARPRRLIRQTARLLTDDGVLLFSSNFRQFQLDAGGMTGLQHEDISRQTLPRARRRLASL